VIIGAGSAATAAMKAIRETDKDGEILLLGDTVQKTLPFHKPPLSDELSTRNSVSYSPVLDFTDVDEEDVEKSPTLRSDSKLTHFRNLHAKSLDPQAHKVTLEDGTIFEYDSCLIATGGSPRTPACLADLPDRTMTYRTINDFKTLKDVCKRVKSVSVIGSGLLASELSSSIAQTGIEVTQLFNGPGIYSKLLPGYLSNYITEQSLKYGVEARTGTVVDTIKKDKGLTLVFDNGEKLDTEFTVICAGTQPNVEVAKSAGLPISKEDGGVVVEPTLEVCPDIYAAGDIISWKDPIFKKYRRVDHHDHALQSGHVAGKNMSGQAIEYHHQPFFWSDLGFIAFEAVGLIESQLENVGVWKTDTDEPLILLSGDSAPKDFQFKTGFVYYLQNTHVVGVLLVGMFGKMEQARAIIVQRRVTINHPEQCKHLISFQQQY